MPELSWPAPPLVIAHRGASARLPENTLAAYELAVEMGADCIEVDLHCTREGCVVITHDEDLARIGGRGEVLDATLAELRELDAGQGERIPTLDETLDQLATRIPFNLELKQSSRGPYPELPAAALRAVRSRGLENVTLFSSFYDSVLAELRALAPEVRIALLISRRFPHQWVERARRVGASALNPENDLVDRALVERAHAEGLAVYVYTVDEPARMEELLGWDVDGIFTNHPDRLRRVVGGGTAQP